MIRSDYNIRLFFIEVSMNYIIIINFQKHHHRITVKILFILVNRFFIYSAMIISQNIHQIFIIESQKGKTFMMLDSVQHPYVLSNEIKI